MKRSIFAVPALAAVLTLGTFVPSASSADTGEGSGGLAPSSSGVVQVEPAETGPDAVVTPDSLAITGGISYAKPPASQSLDGTPVTKEQRDAVQAAKDAQAASGMAPSNVTGSYLIISGVSKYPSVNANQGGFLNKCGGMVGCFWLYPKQSSYGVFGRHVGAGHRTDQYTRICTNYQPCFWSFERSIYGGTYGYWAEVNHSGQWDLDGVF